MTRVRLLRLLVPLVMGAVAAGYVYVRLQELEKRPVTVEPESPVVVAVKAIPARTALDPDMVAVVQVPERFVPEGAFSSPGEAIGKITMVPLSQGETLLKSKLAGAEGSALSYSIPRGRRAITVAVNEIIGVAGHLRAGDRVDVLGTFPREVAGAEKTRLILEDVPVLAVAGDRDPDAQPDPRAYTSVTLSVTPEEGLVLTLAEERGSLRLMLRPAVGDRNWGLAEVSAETFAALPKDPVYRLKAQIRFWLYLVELEAGLLEEFGLKRGVLTISELQKHSFDKLSEFLKAGRARVLEKADLITMNQEPLRYEATGRVPIPVHIGGGEVASWESYGLTLETTPVAYNRPYMDLTLRPELRVLEIVEHANRGREIPFTRIRSSASTVRIDRKEMVAIGGLLREDDFAESKGVERRYILPERYLGQEVRGGARDILMVVIPEVDAR